MHITRTIIKNYRCLQDSNIELNEKLNILVGDNECGKSTFLQAIQLALTWQLNGRPIQSELHPYLFNSTAVTLNSLLIVLADNPRLVISSRYFAQS